MLLSVALKPQGAIPMSLSQALLPEFDQEMANTRKTLERVPDDKFSWKPHPKSGSMGWLAGHLASIPEWAVVTIAQDNFDMNPGGKGFQPGRESVRAAP
jgi:hypothetical protein